MEAGATASVKFNGRVLDLDAGVIRDARGSETALRPQSLAVLKVLMQNLDRVVSKEELMDAVWPGIAVTENSLVQCISEIRRALGDDGQTLLKTVARRGYRLMPPADGNAATVQSPSEPTPSNRRWLMPALAAVGLLTLVAVVALLWPRPEPTATGGPPSIAVLPFQDLSDGGGQVHLVDGFAEDLTTELARVPGLFVVSRKATLAYRDTTLPPAEIAAALGVRYLLEGSVRRAGDAMRISAQLIDTATAGHIWAERFDGSWPEVFALQDRVVASIAGTLKLRLVANDRIANMAGGTIDAQAYEAYLRGWELERRNRPQDIVEAVRWYERALALDRDFGMAAAALAWVYWNADEPRAKALGLSWSDTEDKLYESLDLAARHPSTLYYQLIADLLVREQRSDEAIAALRKAAPLDPSDPWTYEGLSQALIFSGLPVEGRGHLDAAMRVDPGWTDWRHYLAGLAAFGEGRFEAAAASLENIDAGSPDPWPKFYGMQVLLSAYGHLGRAAEIAATRERLEAVLAERNEGQPTQLLARQFFVYKHEADIERLIEGLQKAGVRELPSDVDPHSEHRLRGPEIAALLFGREWQGREVEPEAGDYRAVISTEGAITKTLTASSATGRVRIQGDLMCSAYPRLLFYCGAIFRNPAGTFAQKNEYLIIQRFGRFEFSVAR